MSMKVGNRGNVKKKKGVIKKVNWRKKEKEEEAREEDE